MKKMITKSIIFFYLFVIISFAGSQEKTGVEMAVLVRGPVKSRSFPLIYPNALDFWSGYYRYLEKEVKVSFTRNDILLPKDWISKTCNKVEGYSPSKESFFYKDTEWTVLFQFPSDVSVDCNFISIYLNRLKYFLRDSSPEDPPLLPAILEIP